MEQKKRPRGRIESRTSVRRLRSADRHRLVLELRGQGLHFADIAERVGYAHRRSARAALESALRRVTGTPNPWRKSPEQTKLQREALDLRRGGATFAVIAEKLGYPNRRAARKAVEDELRSTFQGPALAFRRRELARLEILLEAATAKMAGGCLSALSEIMKIEAKQTRLYGIGVKSKAWRTRS